MTAPAPVLAAASVQLPGCCPPAHIFTCPFFIPPLEASPMFKLVVQLACMQDAAPMKQGMLSLCRIKQAPQESTPQFHQEEQVSCRCRGGLASL